MPFTPLSTDPSLPSFPSLSPTQLTGFHDAAHATDLEHRRSMTGYHFMFSGAAIAFRTALQQIVALSSTEAEFHSAILTAKTAKYFCSILHELGFTQHDPTPICGDDKAAMQMINENEPAQRSRHIDYQLFAIQDWRANGDIKMHHVPGIVNTSDSATKALGWTLHHRHACRAMGHCGPSFSS